MNISFLILFLFISSLAVASREVEFEWEEVEGARFYQVEIRTSNEVIQNLQSKSFIFKTNINPGKYQIHGRVFGVGPKKSESDWSAWKDFDIPPAKVKLLPLEKYEFQVDNKNYTAKIPLEWAAVDGINEYFIEVFDDQNVIKKTHSTKNLKTTMQLRPGYYTVRVIARTADGLSSEPTFLEKPILIQNIPVELPKNIAIDEKRRRLSFEPAHATSVHLSLQRQDFLGDTWSEIIQKSPDQNSYQWSPSLKPGKYRFTILSRNSFGEVSKPVFKEFEVKPQENDLPPE